MSQHDARERLFEQFARIGKAMSSPRRLQILELLAQREHTVEDLVDKLGLSFGNTSHHLQILREARLVESRKDGLYVRCRLADPEVLEAYRKLSHLAVAQLEEAGRIVEQYVSDRDSFQPVSREELHQRLKDGTVIVLDVRPPDEYAAGHVAGALSVSLPELAKRLAELPRDKLVVAYCRGPYCMLASAAIERLVQGGFEARRLEEGFPEWREAGYPTDKMS